MSFLAAAASQLRKNGDEIVHADEVAILVIANHPRSFVIYTQTIG